jgi:RNA polymerase sigma-70 factor (ECF subfamily)
MAAPDDVALERQVQAALARCAAGERSALRVIYDLEAGRMAGVARRIVRRQDLAEDAVHDTFLRIWKAAGTFDPERGAARTWIYTILRNCAISILRDEARFVADEGGQELSEDAASTLGGLPESSALRRCLEQLDERRRGLVVLSYVHGLSHGELAGRLKVPLGTVKSWLHRSLLSLQKCLG